MRKRFRTSMGDSVSTQVMPSNDGSATVQQKPMPSDVSSQAVDQLVSAGAIKPPVSYITIGDEAFNSGYIVNLRTSMTDVQYTNLKTALAMIPRQLLKAWFDNNIAPSIDLKFQNIMWAAFVNTFNEANLEKIAIEKLTPWDWEEKKMEAFYISQNADAKKQLDEQFAQYLADKALLAPEAMALMRAYVALPKLGDPGLEINRQNAVKELLKQRDYPSVKAIIDAYRYSQYTVLGPLITQPIPNDINTPDVTVKATPAN